MDRSCVNAQTKMLQSLHVLCVSATLIYPFWFDAVLTYRGGMGGTHEHIKTKW